ncbi:hypothetical protein [Xanthomarina gelatinilytica]|uniref:hypothetical protein n=1 Tax=Xanthomarina gelatinilytica TaxID=1137281 RepID=UPI003AA8DBF3
MKMFKTTILATVFLFGLTAMSNLKPLEEDSLKQTFNIKPDCPQVFLDCDAQYPDDYAEFYHCMRNGGC